MINKINLPYIDQEPIYQNFCSSSFWLSFLGLLTENHPVFIDVGFSKSIKQNE